MPSGSPSDVAPDVAPDVSSDVPSGLVVEPERVADIAAAIRATGRMAFDVEFVSEGRYIPELSLLQVGWGDVAEPHVAAIDFLAVGERAIKPIFALIEDSAVETIAHAARQDLGLLRTRYGVRAHHLVDTQVVAMFCGLGEQIGYASLVRELLGVKVDKSSQFTDWLKRPVSATKLRYALGDVFHLPRVWAELLARLQAAGRESWAREESQRMADAIQPPPEPDVAYLEVKGWRGLRGSQLGSLQAVAAWRQRHAVAENLPLSWVLPDRAMVDLCRNRARNPRALRAVRGVGDGTVRKHGEDILQHIAEGARAEPPVIEDSGKPTLSARASLWAAIVTRIAHACALDMNLPPHLVIGKGEVERLAAWYDLGSQGPEPDIALLSGWRRTVAGDMGLGWLRGDIELRAADSPGGLALRRAPATDNPDSGI